MKLKIMEMNKKRWLILFLIAFLTTIFRVIVQAFMPPVGDGAPSAVAKSGLLPFAFTMYGLITFGLLAVVFVMIQDGLPGTKMIKGLSFGLSFSGMWICYLLEPLPYNSGVSFRDLISYPIADGLTMMFLGLLLGRFLGTNSKPLRKSSIRGKITPFVVIAVFFIATRYIYYSVFSIYSSFNERPLATMVWATITGVWIGMMYLLLSPGMKVKSSGIKALYFGFLIFGIDYTLFNFFIPIVFQASIIEMLVRSLMDIIPVCICVYISGKVSKKWVD